MMKSFIKLFLIAVFVTLSIMSASRESLTFDEIVHVEEGLQAWTNHTFTVDVVNPPLIREIATLPRLAGVQSWFMSRMMITLLGVVLLVVMYLTVSKWFSVTVALASLFFLVFEPNILAHSHYITLDFGYTVFFFITYVYFLSVIRKPTTRGWLLFGVLFGLALASKVSALLFLPPSMLLALVLLKSKKTWHFIWDQRLPIAAGVLLALTVLWGTYFFRSDTIIAEREDSNRVSSKLHKQAKETNNVLLENILLFGENQKLPLGNYLAVLKNSVLFAKNNSLTFFLGEFYSSPRWYFLPITILYKTPIPLMILTGVSLFVLWKKRLGDQSLMLFVIPVPIILIISILSSVRPQIRYMLPIYPFLAIIAARSIEMCKTRLTKIVFILLCVWYMIGSVAEFPHFIAYANILAGPKEKRYEKFHDSNLDWGQTLPDLEHYVKRAKPSSVALSYFGRDDASMYGFNSAREFGSHELEEICSFHTVWYPEYAGPPVTAISITNWYDCGYYVLDKFADENVSDVVGSFLIFNGTKGNR